MTEILDETIGFRKRLATRQQKTGSTLCVGLDPLPDKVPTCLLKEYRYDPAGTITKWMIAVVDATAPYTSMYKLQRAHWEAIGGERAMRNVIAHIQENYPDIVIFLDCKRGDIGRTQDRYRVAHFEVDEVDGVNFSPYMGKDCMEHLVDEQHLYRAIVGLCYTSNPDAREVQDVILEGGRPYWEFIAQTTLKWAEDLKIVENAGLVMAAAYEYPKGSGHIYSYHLSRCRQIVGDKLWFLIPGIGTQGGFIEETIKYAWTGYGSIAVNSSSGIIFASMKEDYAEAAGRKAKELSDDIHNVLKKCNYI